MEKYSWNPDTIHISQVHIDNCLWIRFYQSEQFIESNLAVSQLCTFWLKTGAFWDMGLVHCGVCVTGRLIHLTVFLPPIQWNPVRNALTYQLKNVTLIHSVFKALANQDVMSFELTHWGWDKMAAVFQTTLSNAFSWIKMLWFWLKFHWSLFLLVQLTIFQHLFR